MKVMNCKETKSQMPDLLLDAAFAESTAGAEARVHMATCASCKEQFDGLTATMALLDTWQAPEPSPYFDTRMQVRLREEMAGPPAGFWQRMFSRVEHSSLHAMRPVIAGVMTIAIVIGGATYAGLSFFEQPGTPGGLPAVQASAAVQDLQSMDHNSQTLDDLDSLDQQMSDTGGTDNGNQASE